VRQPPLVESHRFGSLRTATQWMHTYRFFLIRLAEDKGGKKGEKFRTLFRYGQFEVGLGYTADFMEWAWTQMFRWAEENRGCRAPEMSKRVVDMEQNLENWATLLRQGQQLSDMPYCRESMLSQPGDFVVACLTQLTMATVKAKYIFTEKFDHWKRLPWCAAGLVSGSEEDRLCSVNLCIQDLSGLQTAKGLVRP